MNIFADTPNDDQLSSSQFTGAPAVGGAVGLQDQVREARPQYEGAEGTLRSSFANI